MRGATDFVRGIWCDPQETVKNDPDIHRCEDREEKILALDWKELKNIFDGQHFVRMAAELVRKGERLSSEVTYRYKKGSGELEICFGGLCAKPATVESAASRRLDKKYLLVDRPRVSFEEIYGNKEAKEEVKRCIDNIRHPERYTKLMTGILLYGKPGMGKTMFGKAMAYESHAAFISVVGSDFLNGNGVSKMEEVFQTARRRARRDKACILFIDEFDAISKDRGGRLEHYQEIVLERERMTPTSFANALAIPHAFRAYASRSTIAVAQLRSPIQWGTFEVRLVMLFAINEGDRRMIKIFFDWVSDIVSRPEELARLTERCSYEEFTERVME